MKPFSRADRVGELIQQVVSEILTRNIRDPRLKMATITGVKMSKDLRNAKIYFAVSGGSEKVDGALLGFNSAMGYIKRVLAGELELRYMPELKFYYDKSFDYGAHIDALLKSLNAEDGKDHSPFETE
ncbi:MULTISPECIES: 30S ribosome-binding factor RbfA [Desulfococcus]|jgi:ribosome-binding factor A|uniref:Ribosome-binding factor A n=1 Tax=Desulfococcus multivorans DSM 2059 TaxID=1121405 RepID=S7TRE2_DESML|nr:30S ribosome-binding factor RbfA [Desulfococcus multivorans]AOY60305.1 RbfA: ribosome-binding factor [Desulfococcus multivorans]AQV02410.1 ribosome-binding factor A [Desulfococcus multivorans]EPR39230.1 Ribosome-binding factor A [Desulfococcus multivorans DSM 2059]MDX9817939.1 30S ribosome-binding factor RbfA [Desulfococcus multivorans]SJZ58386.1 ribosome-binding factor A [Desulfococcus multivorans DSM 2059]